MVYEAMRYPVRVPHNIILWGSMELLFPLVNLQLQLLLKVRASRPMIIGIIIIYPRYPGRYKRHVILVKFEFKH